MILHRIVARHEPDNRIAWIDFEFDANAFARARVRTEYIDVASDRDVFPARRIVAESLMPSPRRIGDDDGCRRHRRQAREQPEHQLETGRVWTEIELAGVK